jgi:glutamate carboxypeptidase
MTQLHPGQVADEARATIEGARAMKDEFVDFLSRLVGIESPTDHPDTQRSVHTFLGPELESLGFDVRVIPGRVSGGHLYARPRGRRRHRPSQLLIGHSDTVWPLDTLGRMPVRVVDGRLHGPGALDMKGGLAQIIFALKLLRSLQLEPEVTPVILMNSDEEVGSPESRPWVRRLARAANRAFILEPSMGADGKIKTARKGVGRFEITIRGRAAHAGLEPELGASAILELSHVIQELHALNDPERGTTVNVGIIDGGIRPNVVAPLARATVDVRISTMEDGRRLEEAVAAIQPSVPGVQIAIEGGIGAAPLERTPRNRLLWERVREAGGDLGLELEETMAGGGSDGNTTSMFTATVDGLGCVGDGAHADHEHIVIDPSLERCALLARLLLAPPQEQALD